MKLGFGLPHSGTLASPEGITLVAKRAEELGYESLWVSVDNLNLVKGTGLSNSPPSVPI